MLPGFIITKILDHSDEYEIYRFVNFNDRVKSHIKLTLESELWA